MAILFKNQTKSIFLDMGLFLMAMLIKLWCCTCRIEKRANSENETRMLKKYGGCIYPTWHQRMFYFFYEFGRRHVIMMISKSRDGEYANAVAGHLGFRSVRGSGSRNYRRAILDLIHMLKKGNHSAGMMADGPQGPPRKLKMGTIKLAKETGKPILPMMYGAKRRIVFNSWDRYFLPFPFTRIIIMVGQPVSVAPNADAKECEHIRQEVETQLNKMADRCDAFWGGTPVGKPGFDLPSEQ
jgi:lysophospholipid acyltransferase (LPLAT)-like uncharacterized protein